jgi:hypothetical protein
LPESNLKMEDHCQTITSKNNLLFTSFWGSEEVEIDLNNTFHSPFFYLFTFW